MPSYRTAFPSKYIKAEDLGVSRPIGTIHSVDFEDVGAGANKDSKLVVHFLEASLKPLVLNMINSETISEIARTDDYEQWPGSRVQLYASRTEFQGKRVPCIRLCPPPVVESTVQAKRVQRPAAPVVTVDDLDDAIPTLAKTEEAF